MRLLILTAYFVLLTESIIGQKIIHDGRNYYFKNKIIVKFNQDDYNLNNRILTKLSQSEKLGITGSKPMFKKPSKSNSILKNIYVVTTNGKKSPKLVASKFSKQKKIKWAEPYYLNQIVFTPNDPKYLDSTTNQKKMLGLIKAEQAWDINKGSSKIIIGIVDTGIDWDHPDLANHIWINEDEIPDNGIDDDNNGYIDDYRGWDFGGLDGTPDNNPMEDRPDHGTLLAGLASAVTNNDVGIASIGFNSTVMAVKTSQNDVRTNAGTALISFGYEGVVYAVDNGANIINCSWGSFSYSSFAQSVIDYAVSKGVLVVAAAGNNNSQDSFYPASYNGVLSVGASDYSDNKAGFSNYGIHIDVIAPGVGIYSTWQNDTYSTASGTSMSSPIVAGLAALVKNEFPNYSPLQIGEQIRSNADNIDGINQSYQYLLGAGRINAFKALSNKNSKSLRLTNVKYFDRGDGDGIIESGEEIEIEVGFTNYLAPLSNLQLNLVNNSSFVSVINGNYSAGSMSTLQTKNNSGGKFRIKINQNAPDNIDVNLRVDITDGTYNDFQWITFNVNPTYVVQNVNNVSLTITSNGSLGFNDFPNNQQGGGLTYKDGPNLLYEGALIYGTSAQTINDAARNTDASGKDEDFFVIKPVSLNTPGNEADQQSFAVFNDSNATNRLGIKTKQSSFSFSDAANENFVILRYRMINTTANTINNFYAGIFFDLDIDENDWDGDVVKFDTTNNFGYAFDQDGNPVNTNIGFALLSNGPTNFYAMDQDGNNGGVVSWDGLTDDEKWSIISSGLSFPEAGPSDISLVISGGPYTINSSDSIDIAFVVAEADNYSNLKQAIIQSRNKYTGLPSDVNNNFKQIPAEFKLEQNYPNPFNPTTTIQYSISTPLNPPFARRGNTKGIFVSLKVFDILGREVAVLVNKRQLPGKYSVTFNASSLPSGVYFYSIQVGSFHKTEKSVLLK